MGKPFGSRLPSRAYKSKVFEITAGATSHQLSINPAYRHSFAGVEYYSDSLGANLVTPLTGLESYSLKTPMQPNSFQSFLDNKISANTPDQVSWASNVITVKVELSNIDLNATHARLIVVSNIS